MKTQTKVISVENKEEAFNDSTNESYSKSIEDKDISAFSQYLKDVSHYTLLTFNEEKTLSKRIQNRDSNALESLINSNLRLVIKIATYFAKKGYNLNDLIQEGNIGLMRAAQKYDYTKNVRFAAYAGQWIKQTMIRALQKAPLVKLPYRKEQVIKKLNNISLELLEEYNRKPTINEISKKVKIPISAIKKAQEYKITIVSIDSQAEENSNFGIEHAIPADEEGPIESLLSKDLAQEMNKALRILSAKERKIIAYRFGLGSKERHSLKTIGEKLGISQESVRQIAHSSLKKLKNNHEYLEEYMTG